VKDGFGCTKSRMFRPGWLSDSGFGSRWDSTLLGFGVNIFAYFMRLFSENGSSAVIDKLT